VIKAVLFDLDGTLADTAPDLGYAVNCMREARGLPPLPASATRPVTSLGARGLLNAGFGIAPDHPDYGAMREEFLLLYERNICRYTRLFPGTDELLSTLDARGLRWGIVTNKPEGLAVGVVEGFGWTRRCAVLVGGDTLPQRKPDPAPILLACERLGIAPGEAIYVGDDERDIVAARAAGMVSVAALWGYREPGDDPLQWGADHACTDPADLMTHPGLLPS
jgi:2-phosphoglycolate phosphatase